MRATGSALVLGALLAPACSSGGGAPAAQAPPAVDPPQLQYAVQETTLLRAVAMHPLEPTLAGGSPDAFEVTPPLPDGLALDPGTGTISGSATGVQDWTVHTVKATNDGGSGSVELAIRVLDSFDHTRFAYATNFLSASVTRYAVDPESGSLRTLGVTPAGDKPLFLTTYPTGEFVYVGNYAGSSISMYRVDAQSGNLESLGEVVTGTQPVDLEIDPSGRFLYVAQLGVNAISTFAIDRETGVLTPVGPAAPALGPAILRISDDGRFLYAGYFNSTSVGIYTVDAASGELTPIDAAQVGESPIWLEISRDGRTMVVANFGTDDITTLDVDPATGALTPVATIPVENGPAGVAFDSRDRVYVTNFVVNSVFVFDASGGASDLVLLDQFAVANQPLQVATRPDDDAAYVPNARSHEVSRLPVTESTGFVGPELSLPLEQVRSRLGTSGIAFVRTADPAVWEPQAVYVANSGFDDVSQLTVDPADGSLVDTGQPLATGDRPERLATDALHRVLVAAASADGSLAPFAIDAATGSLTASGPPVSGATANRDLALSPDSPRVYVSGSEGVVVREVDPETGTLGSPLVGAPHPGPDAIAIDPTGAFVAVATPIENELQTFTVDAESSDLVPDPNGPFKNAPNLEPTAIAFHPNGRFVFTANEVGDSVSAFLIDALTGDLLFLEEQFCGEAPRDLVVHPHGMALYTANRASGDVTALQVERLSGQLQLLQTIPAGQAPSGLSVDVAGRFLYVADEGADRVRVYSIDPTDGALASAGSLPLAGGAAPSDVLVTSRLVEQEAGAKP